MRVIALRLAHVVGPRIWRQASSRTLNSFPSAPITGSRIVSAALVDSQFATLEMPDPETENVLALPVTDPVEKLTMAVVKNVDHLKSFKRWQ